MPKFRRRPTVVEAVPIADLAKPHFRRPSEPWVEEAVKSGRIRVNSDCIEIATLEGVMRGERNDWLVKGVVGELFPVKPEAFEKNYEPAPGENDVPL